MAQTTEVNPELDLIEAFLADCLPFDSLSDDQRRQCAADMGVRYYSANRVFEGEDAPDGLYVLRSGAVDRVDLEGNRLEHLEEGDSFLLRPPAERPKDSRYRSAEDVLVYRLDYQAYLTLCGSHRHIDRFFRAQSRRRLRQAARHSEQPSYLLGPVSAVMSADPLVVLPEDSVCRVAQAMTERRVSSALVARGDVLVGIVTDRDFRSRVLAAELDGRTSIADCMSSNLVSLSPDDSLFDAVLTMTQSGIHHLPVTGERGQPVGMLTTSDINVARENDPVYFVQRLMRMPDVGAMQAHLKKLPALVAAWVGAEMPATQVTQLTTAVSDAVAQRLIALAEDELGPAPGEYCWLGFGSQARGEQLLGGDQDNGLLIADEVADHELPWFIKLAHFVSDGLDACGYVYCPGGVMATSPEWCQRLSGWCDTVDGWLKGPTPDAVMRVSIFFDLRAIHGSASLCQKLQTHMLAATKNNSIFLAALAENALASRPPLGVLRRFILERSGDHHDTLNLKKRGVLPIVELTRLHALAQGIDAVNTHKRLQALTKAGVMALADSRNLEDALTLITQIRLDAQVQQLLAGETPSNYLDPKSLGKLQRGYLKDAFTVVNDAQTAARMRYRPGL